MHLLASIVGIALLVNCCTAVLEHFRVRYLGLLLAQEADQGPNVVDLDVVLALLEIHHVDIFLVRHYRNSRVSTNDFV